MRGHNPDAPPGPKPAPPPSPPGRCYAGLVNGCECSRCSALRRGELWPHFVERDACDCGAHPEDGDRPPQCRALIVGRRDCRCARCMNRKAEIARAQIDALGMGALPRQRDEERILAFASGAFSFAVLAALVWWLTR